MRMFYGFGKGAAERGAIMWASWYGYPYWLSTSGCAAGSKDGTSSNLQQGKESRFIKHIIDVYGSISVRNGAYQFRLRQPD